MLDRCMKLLNKDAGHLVEKMKFMRMGSVFVHLLSTSLTDFVGHVLLDWSMKPLNKDAGHLVEKMKFMRMGSAIVLPNMF